MSRPGIPRSPNSSARAAPRRPTATAACSPSATAATTPASTSSQRVAADWITAAGLTIEDTGGIRALLLDRYRDWSPNLRRLLTDNDGRYVDRPIHALPVPHTWEHNPTVTLLGDAAHLMPPLGVGVNLALLDACELALAVVQHDTVHDAVLAHEKTMLPRSTQMQQLLDHGAEELLSTELADFAQDATATD
ncbi:FAD-dependent oxidoreductase [Prauserella muralis]|uniref:FAD-dependent oxidoreductase n=1 Tax=Prauserella muralis TaxID=588067 RepID=UPI001FEBB05A|nr:FAD-dependent monooxygenase [Prauserella muralis]